MKVVTILISVWHGAKEREIIIEKKESKGDYHVLQFLLPQHPVVVQVPHRGKSPVHRCVVKCLRMYAPLNLTMPERTTRTTIFVMNVVNHIDK